jgi:hypothetical protein
VGDPRFPFDGSLIIHCLRSYVDQLNQILHYLGTPSEDTLRRVGSPRVRPNFFFFFSRFLSLSAYL